MAQIQIHRRLAPELLGWLMGLVALCVVFAISTLWERPHELLAGGVFSRL
jgi:hypothetical protein